MGDWDRGGRDPPFNYAILLVDERLQYWMQNLWLLDFTRPLGSKSC